MRPRRLLPLALLLFLGGCAYYNGMYNANRFAKRAKKAAAQGRTFEAQGYWAQAEVRADTVIARHPDSQWADDAQLIRGEAMVSRGDCAGAIPALEYASLSRDSPDVVEKAQVLLGRCRLQTGDLAGADQAFVALMQSADTAIRHAAQLRHAQTLTATGAHEEAIATLNGLEGVEADAVRAVAYAGTGNLEAALPFVDSAIARQDLNIPWDSTLAGIGRVDPLLASQYTTRVVAINGMSGEERDELLGADGLRLLPEYPDSGLARLAQASVAKPITTGSLVARLEIAEYFIAQADTFADLERAREWLAPLSELGGPSAISALRYLAVLDRLRSYVDSVSPESPEGDLATFVMGESVRDGLLAPRIAAELFATVPTWWPASPYAPKALLALAALRPEEAASIYHGLECAYPESPYLELVAGGVTPAVVALEDSLRVYIAAVGAGATLGGGARRAAPTGGTRGSGVQKDELR